MKADYPPEPPLITAPQRDVRPKPGEVAYVPGPVAPQPSASAWQKARTRLRQEEALAVPRSTMDDVALAKQALLDYANAPAASRPRRNLPRVKPVQAAAAVAMLVLVVTYVPMTRTAFKVGLIFALRSAITRMISRYV